MSGWTALSVAIGGAIGSLSRYAVGRAITSVAGTTFPWGTLIVNLLGSFAMGVWMSYFTKQATPSAEIPQNVVLWDHALRIGFLGGFTTFSALSYETFDLLHDNRLLLAGLSLLGNLVTGLLLVWFGLKVGLFLTTR